MTDVSPSITFWIHGTPRPAGSKKGFPIRRANGKIGVVISDQTGDNGKIWRNDIREAYRQALIESKLHPTGTLFGENAVVLGLAFYLPRPKKDYRSNGELKPNAPVWPLRDPDCTKLTRAIEDALNGVAWDDDNQVVRQHVSKDWARHAGAMISISLA
jgi:Holliday junction resolvase RusA-like endonuclease